MYSLIHHHLLFCFCANVFLLFFSDMMYGSRYTLEDVVQSMKKTGVGLKGSIREIGCVKKLHIFACNRFFLEHFYYLLLVLGTFTIYNI